MRRSRSFIRMPIVAAAGGGGGRADPGARNAAREIGTLLRDALLRARLAVASASADEDAGKRQHSLVTARRACAGRHIPLPRNTKVRAESASVVDAMFALASAYSTPGA